MSHAYDDLLPLPHPVSRRHPPMNSRERAAQFAPFAALNGYEAAIEETARRTEPQMELSEEERAELNAHLRFWASHIREHPMAAVVFFVPDAHKEGGAYLTHRGRLKRVDEVAQTLIFEDGQRVPFDTIWGVE